MGKQWLFRYLFLFTFAVLFVIQKTPIAIGNSEVFTNLSKHPLPLSTGNEISNHKTRGNSLTNSRILEDMFGDKHASSFRSIKNIVANLPGFSWLPLGSGLLGNVYAVVTSGNNVDKGQIP